MKSIGILGLAVVVVGAFLFATINLLAELENQRENQLRFVSQIGEIKRLDEVLTMSSRMAASGGGGEYIERYNENVAKLDKVLADTSKVLIQDQQAQSVSATDAANSALVEMETRALELVDLGLSEQAWKLLHSQAYRDNKEKYWEGMEKAFSLTQVEIAKLYSQTETIAAVIMGVGIVAFILVCLFAIHQKYGSAREKQELIDQLLSNEAELTEKTNALTQNELKLKNIISDLEAAKEKAQSADRSKSNFLANMSHEIRTPMNGVMGMAELLAKTELTDKQKMFTDVILKSGASLLTIINDILDFSKLDAHQFQLDPVPFNLAEAVEDVATLVSAKVAEKNIEMIVRLDPELPTAFVGDVGRIRQILTNLVGNAVKFTEKGHVFVNIEKRVQLDSASNSVGLHVSVEDTGIGISEEQIGKVFEKFSQVDSTATRKHEGTGLGLSICQHLVELMGGDIGVESELGSGAKFWFDIELPVHHEVLKRIKIPVDITGARILVVDDNEVNRAILREQVTSWNFDCAAVSSGREALDLIDAALQESLTIDCVLLDYMMPEMNGGDVIKAMHSNPACRDIPVIMFTSVQETSDGKLISSLGAQCNLIKPARSSKLLESIVDVLQRHNNGKPVDGTELATGAKQQMVEPREVKCDDAASSMKVSRQVKINPSSAIDVLVCEDNEVNQIVIEQILEEQGFNYKIANNGLEGLDLFQALRPAAILMDVSMPEMNGLDATREIRELEAASGTHTPIIGVTAHAVTGDAEMCLEAGMDDYLSKPVSPKKLIEMLSKWIGQGELADTG